MESYPNTVAFKGRWRSYQQRVLDELATHLNDDHLHVVAPPGSGKTLLGLEVVRRLNQRTLICAPTLAIRDQWVHRFVDFFWRFAELPTWISTDVNAPGFLTVTTYQALDDEAVDSLIKANIRVLVADEAHHLKNAWWRQLDRIKGKLAPTIVALTATPPYDVSYTEWERYSSFNGPIDAQITVPELVNAGDLCVHQDYICFSRPNETESGKLNTRREAERSLIERTCADEDLIAAYRAHPYIAQPLAHLDQIYTHIETFSAALIFLHQAGFTVEPEHLDVIGDRRLKLPELTDEWLAILLNDYLANDHFADREEHREGLRRRLKRGGALPHGQVQFGRQEAQRKLLTTSLGKLNSVLEIVHFEYDQLGSGLRLVVLTDFIRNEFLTERDSNDLEVNRIGAVPVFELLRRSNKVQRIAVLTGSTVILPITSLAAFAKAMGKIGTPACKTLAFDDRFSLVCADSRTRHAVIRAVTTLFQEGHIHVLIGTMALLGEGWDAPAINTLVLASFVGSFVQSNQMRGRAIRIDPKKPDAMANIWHLVCYEAGPGGDTDLQLLHRRCQAFVGVSHFGEPRIESGADRFGFEVAALTTGLDQINQATFASAGARQDVSKRWRVALDQGSVMQIEMEQPYPSGRNYRQDKALALRNTIRNLFYTLVAGLAVGAETLLELSGLIIRLDNPRTIGVVLTLLAATGAAVFGRRAYRALRLYLKYRDIADDVRHIGEALRATLCDLAMLETARNRLSVESQLDDKGVVTCRLVGGTRQEQIQFAQSLQEIVSPIENPRYLIERRSRWLAGRTRSDYHAVPKVLGENKKAATCFQANWSAMVGRCDLIYARSLPGRRKLLWARMNSLSAQFVEPAKQISVWR